MSKTWWYLLVSLLKSPLVTSAGLGLVFGWGSYDNMLKQDAKMFVMSTVQNNLLTEQTAPMKWVH